MRPESRVWRKGRRAAAKGAKRGRRTTHTTETETPRRGSTWARRHLSQQPGTALDPTASDRKEAAL